MTKTRSHRPSSPGEVATASNMNTVGDCTPISKTLEVSFDRGLIVVKGQVDSSLFPFLEYDDRLKEYAAEAFHYRRLVLACRDQGYTLNDHARNYDVCDFKLTKEIEPRPHQAKAMEAWKNSSYHGCCVLPTGAGKTILAVMAIATLKRTTLVVVPTIDLLHQWQKTLNEFFGVEIGGYGGGEKNLREITVATYDSAKLIIEHYGTKFGFIVFDECHHLPAPQYQMIARSAVAPFRLGLSATIERADGGEETIYEIVGEKVYEATITDMVSKVLAPYDVVTVEVCLSEKEKAAYEAQRKVYLDFVRSQRIQLSSPTGWSDFIKLSARSHAGKRAMRAYRNQKKLAAGSEAKIKELWRIFSDHIGERIIIFTADNDLAYEIGKRYFLPVLTHHTKAKERKFMLDSFRGGSYSVLVTSKVLNEGVDVPEASVGVVVSGSGSVREHVQRLGRILRHKDGKRARLYELISMGTGEKWVKQRRRQHHAYQKSH